MIYHDLPGFLASERWTQINISQHVVFFHRYQRLTHNGTAPSEIDRVRRIIWHFWPSLFPVGCHHCLGSFPRDLSWINELGLMMDGRFMVESLLLYQWPFQVPKLEVHWYSTSILGSWNSHWLYMWINLIWLIQNVTIQLSRVLAGLMLRSQDAASQIKPWNDAVVDPKTWVWRLFELDYFFISDLLNL